MSGPARSPHGGTATTSRSWRGESVATVRGGCVNPVRLRGYYQQIAADTGELLAAVGAPESGEILLVSCKDRRASLCPACSRLYQRDAYQLIAAGLRGGKSIPAVVGGHPAVVVTLTAPSFGAVHGNHETEQVCKCGQHHEADDALLGTPIEPEHYRYAEQLIWNHYAPELWKRTVQGLRRGLAHALGVPRSKLSTVAYVRFAKVAEFQRRGVVHYHAIIRLDGPADTAALLPVGCTRLLEQIAAAAIETAAIPLPDVLFELSSKMAGTVRWGTQREIAALSHDSYTRTASYIAKYATKATEAAAGGTLIKPIRSRQQLDTLQISPHAHTLIATAWAIGQRTGIDGFKRWAHQFGYGGHTLTKSRHYSITFAALRAARADWHRTASRKRDVIVRMELAFAGRVQSHGFGRTG